MIHCVLVWFLKPVLLSENAGTLNQQLEACRSMPQHAAACRNEPKFSWGPLVLAPNPTLPFAHKTAPRGRGKEHMLKETSLATRGIAPIGGPRTRLLSKITGALEHFALSSNGNEPSWASKARECQRQPSARPNRCSDQVPCQNRWNSLGRPRAAACVKQAWLSRRTCCSTSLSLLPPTPPFLWTALCQRWSTRCLHMTGCASWGRSMRATRNAPELKSESPKWIRRG